MSPEETLVETETPIETEETAPPDEVSEEAPKTPAEKAAFNYEDVLRRVQDDPQFRSAYEDHLAVRAAEMARQYQADWTPRLEALQQQNSSRTQALTDATQMVSRWRGDLQRLVRQGAVTADDLTEAFERSGLDRALTVFTEEAVEQRATQKFADAWKKQSDQIDQQRVAQEGQVYFTGVQWAMENALRAVNQGETFSRMVADWRGTRNLSWDDVSQSITKTMKGVWDNGYKQGLRARQEQGKADLRTGQGSDTGGRGSPGSNRDASAILNDPNAKIEDRRRAFKEKHGFELTLPG